MTVKELVLKLQNIDPSGDYEVKLRIELQMTFHTSKYFEVVDGTKERRGRYPISAKEKTIILLSE